MEIKLNGKPESLPDAATLPELLAKHALTGIPVLVEINGRALLPREIPQTALQHGDVVELIRIVAGG
jgi:thiamine biosynthesis protein ThiS